MLKVGLTGGYATGKSFVGDVLAGLGCYLIRADELGHQVLLPAGAAYAAVVREFGERILNPDGTIDRKRLAGEVFGRPERLAVLNGLVHPPVIRREEELIARRSLEDPGGIAVVEAAILVETGSYRRFDRLIVTVCRPDQQIERAMARNGLTREQVEQRLSRQMPLEEKRKYADYVIDTSGAKEDTVRQVREVYAALRSVKL
ncbi:MAG: dephospho-CoA kinase [Bryobacterales bacterium]|nr:dephospho-CoA kinase [Bryobacterales bacterium]